MNKEQIGSFVLSERKKQGLSQKGLAIKAGLSRYQQILEIEKAHFDYGTDVLIKVIDTLGYKLAFVDPEWETKVNIEVKDESIVPSKILFDFSKAKAATEEDNIKFSFYAGTLPDKSEVKKKQVKKQPTAIFKRKK